LKVFTDVSKTTERSSRVRKHVRYFDTSLK